MTAVVPVSCVSPSIYRPGALAIDHAGKYILNLYLLDLFKCYRFVISERQRRVLIALDHYEVRASRRRSTYDETSPG